MESANPKCYNKFMIWKRKEGQYFLCKGYKVLFRVPKVIARLLGK